MHANSATSVPLSAFPDASITPTSVGPFPQPETRSAAPVLQERPATDGEALLPAETGAQAQMRRAMRSMINHQNNEGETALMTWASQGNIRMVKMLLETGADPSLKNRLGQSALDLAAGHDDVIDLLRQHN